MEEVETRLAPRRPRSTEPEIPPAPTVSTTGASKRPVLFVVIWAASWAFIGLIVGLAIVLSQEEPSRNFWQIMKLSVLFAEVVGLTALSSSRLIFPYFASLPYLPRVFLQIVTLGGGALFGTLIVASLDFLYTIHSLPKILPMIFINATLALVVGIAVNTYESMKRQIQRSYEDLRKKEVFDREMDFAREVQEQLFPKTVPKAHGIQVAGICLPAAGVGGDYYDYLPLSDDRIGLVVADVSGKGISAALLMASLHASVRNVIGPEMGPGEVAQRLNTFLYRSTTASRYATLFLVMFDGRDCSLRYSNAGHNPPILVRESGTTKLSEGGLPLGIFHSSRYHEGRAVLRPDDLLLLYTDGAVEAANPAGQEYGLERLTAFLKPRRHTEDLPGLIQDTLAEIHAWTQASPQQDDITVVLARAVSVN